MQRKTPKNEDAEKLPEVPPSPIQPPLRSPSVGWMGRAGATVEG
jgi:hypothetical protein